MDCATLYTSGALGWMDAPVDLHYPPPYIATSDRNPLPTDERLMNVRLACRIRWVPLVLLLTPATAFPQSRPITSNDVSNLRFRSIGPAVTGGRIHDVEALPDDPSTLYVATASGGIWKSINKGTTWKPIFDNEAVSTFGDMAIAPSNPDIIWAGTGEQNNRQSTSWGNGVYRSTDGGDTWTHLGLEKTLHTGRLAVHPQDPDVAFVAALGNLWAASPDRGVYKTTDGGETWRQVLYVDAMTGAIDLVMHPTDPNTLYVAMYQRMRRAWGFNGGGPGSGIYKTTDGGSSWQELTNGIPAGDKGRIGLAISATNPMVLNATVQHASESGVYRTADGGTTWEQVNSLNPRPMYYSHIFIDPTEENRVYVVATSFYKSEDGGHTFETLPTRPTYDVGVHSDFHSMWIDPSDPEHFYLAGDGGLHETWDMGQTYIRMNNIPIGQFYAIGVDMRDPYYIAGGMQDNHSWIGPSATRHWIGIINDDWRQIGFGDGMYQQIDPTDHRYVYVLAQNGNIIRLDAETGDMLGIRPYPPPGEPAYRFDWVTPSLVSRHDPRVFYLGGNRLFISRNRGDSWERTEDLTKQIDRDTLRIMGVLGSDSMLSRNDGTSSFGEIVTIAESPLDAAVLWIGTDDGNIQVSRDGGATWTEVARNVRGVRPGTYVSRVIASASGPGRAYATFDAHRDGDFAPYVFRTEDYGRTWTSLTNNLPDGSLNVIVEHPSAPALLFLGSEHGLFVSTDAGGHWAEFGANLPTTAYDDLVIHPRENDLVVGTHGRSIWIFDDLTPLVEWSRSAPSTTAHLFPARPATIFQYWKDTSYRGQAAYAGENPPFGTLATYHLPEDVESAQLEIVNAGGDTVRTLDVPAAAGMHRVTWDLRHPLSLAGGGGSGGGQAGGGAATSVPLPQPVNARGPFVSPGAYTAVLTAGGARSVQPVVVRGDPLLALTDDQWRERERFLLELQRFQAEIQETIDWARTIRGNGNGIDADSLQSIERSLRQLRGRVGGMAAEFNGRGVRQGSLLPPTETHRVRQQTMGQTLDRLREAIRRFTDR